ncbi:MAG: phosphoglycerate kinase [Candidatus Sericytochromatia bacterium]|uniref:Phosphoglycerate kinase n=1 Tax=Candidatus Tanganyikabacteria bacterium TaxID=2961651 RepID=A0A937X364_9BACT|nr:phosphoglycerate kinase [Candidatus Tanganyikabacteria bacterium]
MAFRTLDSLAPDELRGKRVLVREDLNVPLEDGRITDDTRIRAALPTLKALRDRGAKIIVVSHLGRPKGVDPTLSLAPVAGRLGELLGVEVTFDPGFIGGKASDAVARLQSGDVLLLENVRFKPEEEKNDPAFARELASLADFYVNDAFGTAHRAHASTEGVARLLPSAAGYLMARELDVLGRIVSDPERPFWAIIGGSKVSSKIGVLRHLLSKVDGMVIGGAMANTFFKAKGLEVGKSLVEDDWLETAREVAAEAERRGVKLLLPVDVSIGTDPKSQKAGEVPVTAIPADMSALDVGKATIMDIYEALAGARTILWNGPLGVFESEDFAVGTRKMAEMLADLTHDKGATSVVGGGDSVAALEQAGLADRITHVSTGGGASLEFLEGQTLPGVAALESKAEVR